MPERKVRKKSPTTPEPGELVQPKHGRGLIRHGSTPETAVAGPGRPSSVIRQKLRGSFEQRIKTLEEIADAASDDKVSTADRLKAIDLMGKYGVGAVKAMSEDEIKDRLLEQIQLIQTRFPEFSEEILAVIEPVWSK